MPYQADNVKAPTQNVPVPKAPTPSSFIQQDQADLNSSNVNTQAAGVIGAGQASGIAGSDMSMAALMNEIGLTVPEAQAQSAYNVANEGIGLAGIGLSQEQNAIQQSGEAASLGETQALFGLQSQQTPESLAEAALANKNAVQSQRDQAAISGTLGTQGDKQAVDTQAQQYAWDQADINRGQQEANVQEKFSVGDIARSEQGLALAAANNGLSVEQLKDQFALGQANLKTGAQGSLDQLYTQYLAQQSGAISGVASTGAEEGLLTPGSILSTGTSGGLNLNTLFAGAS
jgi:hypothetical protein